MIFNEVKLTSLVHMFHFLRIPTEIKSLRCPRKVTWAVLKLKLQLPSRTLLLLFLEFRMLLWCRQQFRCSTLHGTNWLLGKWVNCKTKAIKTREGDLITCTMLIIAVAYVGQNAPKWKQKFHIIITSSSPGSSSGQRTTSSSNGLGRSEFHLFANCFWSF